MIENIIERYCKFIKYTFITLLVIIVFFIAVFPLFFRLFPEKRIIDNSFNFDLNTLELVSPTLDDKGRRVRYTIGGIQFDPYIEYDIYGFAGKTDGRYLTEDMLLPGDSLCYWINDDVCMILFEIEGLSSNEWIMLCRDYGNGDYYWIGVYKAVDVTEIPQIIQDLGSLKRSI